MILREFFECKFPSKYICESFVQSGYLPFTNTVSILKILHLVGFSKNELSISENQNLCNKGVHAALTAAVL